MRYGVLALPCSNSRTSPPLAASGSYERRHHEEESLRRVLERLRAATDGRFQRRTSVRSGVQQPQRMQMLLALARSGSRT